ncbi:MAG: MotA/TolQ/ExbB proton channel family protein [Kiritimatiellae bacterium]|jgi:biopolymer transport protein ExbB|nr:MotA/TolQ/ExbB proton channel family protein [Kiritimatiellia bacterium]MDD4341841.1 MotA/TolQ/ExbB proton channel family protein [Kiritimatiellia bacterium]MDY0148972.1 MotA/TolQ/ExbB proton channel family protein [Kiritimatiellia bacterium]
MSKKSLMVLWLVVIAALVIVPMAGWAQDLVMDEAANAEAAEDAGSMGLWSIIAGSGWLGIILWTALLGCSVAAAWLAIDFSITVNPKKIIPDSLVNDVREAMEQGDVMKAMQRCEEEPGVLSSILLAGFNNVKEGFEVIQEQVASAADLESEKLMQRVSYLNMCGSIAPMLGLLGTVQGMIMAFANLANTQAGAAQQSMLAMNIAQALWTTAAGLCVAIPSVSLFTYFKNRLSRIILTMEGLTIDLIKALRNVEIVEE